MKSHWPVSLLKLKRVSAKTERYERASTCRKADGCARFLQRGTQSPTAEASWLMDEQHTTTAVQHVLDELDGTESDSAIERIIRALLSRAVRRLQLTMPDGATPEWFGNWIAVTGHTLVPRPKRLPLFLHVPCSLCGDFVSHANREGRNPEADDAMEHSATGDGIHRVDPQDERSNPQFAKIAATAGQQPVEKVSDAGVGYKVFREREARQRVRPLFNGLTGDAKRRRSRRPTMERQNSSRSLPRGTTTGG
jgi:hypothetical protein